MEPIRIQSTVTHKNISSGFYKQTHSIDVYTIRLDINQITPVSAAVHLLTICVNIARYERHTNEQRVRCRAARTCYVKFLLLLLY